MQLSPTDARRFYVDDERFVVEQTGAEERRLGPKAARGSVVSATVPVNSTDVLLFFVDEDMGLASLKWDGSEWSEGICFPPTIPRVSTHNPQIYKQAPG